MTSAVRRRYTGRQSLHSNEQLYSPLAEVKIQYNTIQ